jgi:hypothetical protein
MISCAKFLISFPKNWDVTERERVRERERELGNKMGIKWHHLSTGMGKS